MWPLPGFTDLAELICNWAACLKHCLIESTHLPGASKYWPRHEEAKRKLFIGNFFTSWVFHWGFCRIQTKPFTVTFLSHPSCAMICWHSWPLQLQIELALLSSKLAGGRIEPRGLLNGALEVEIKLRLVFLPSSSFSALTRALHSYCTQARPTARCFLAVCPIPRIRSDANQEQVVGGVGTVPCTRLQKMRSQQQPISCRCRTHPLPLPFQALPGLQTSWRPPTQSHTARGGHQLQGFLNLLKGLVVQVLPCWAFTVWPSSVAVSLCNPLLYSYCMMPCAPRFIAHAVFLASCCRLQRRVLQNTALKELLLQH